MKITIYRSTGEQLTRDYDLTNCSVDELVNGLNLHCKEFDIDPLVAGISLADEDGHIRLIKKSCVISSIRNAAIKILKHAGRDYSNREEDL